MMGELEKLQTDAAKRFLQTVLIVDDQVSIFPPGPSSEDELVKDVEEPPGPNMAGASPLAQGGSSQAPPSSEERVKQEQKQEERASEVNVKRLADRFADLDGLTCGMLKPAEEEDKAKVTERIVKAARGVDIVVLDWMLEEPGFTARDAVAGIVAAEPKDRRLIAIYTTQRDLVDIAEQIREAVAGASEVQGEELAVDAGGIRILIYHKGGPRIEKELEQHVCPEEKLPERLIADFVAQTAGLVPAVALSALAASRENTHRLLNRLHQDLDLGYLGQILRLDPDEGKKHLLDTIIGEFRAVVEDDAETGSVAVNGFSAWLADHEGELQKPIDDLKEARFGEYPKNKITALLVDKARESDALKSDASFAQLMAMRRPYSRQDPPLHLGTIVREREPPGNYWLCIQPVCDSVRLEKPTAFLMLPLDPVDLGERAMFVVTLSDDPVEQHVLLHLWNGVADLELMRLDPNSKGSVVFTGEDLKTVTTEEGIVLTWIAQLKPAHASRVAHAYGMQLSRVGLDESEWLRRLSTKGNKPEQQWRSALTERTAQPGEALPSDKTQDSTP